MKPKQLNNFDLKSVRMDLLHQILTTYELAILLDYEPYTTESDIMFDNMLEYYVSNEIYEYAIIVRDEINKRKTHQD